MKRLLSRGTTAAAVGVLAVLIAGGGYALASSNTIKACVAHTNKDIYKKNTCKSGDKKLTWNKQGPQGPQGPKGDTGATGATGATGPAGSGFTANFTAFVPYGNNETVTVGSFTLSEATAATTCSPVSIKNASANNGQLAKGAPGGYAALAAGATTNITNAAPVNSAGWLFSATINGGQSAVFGDVGADSLAGGCEVTGFMVGY
jgi:hypothetical protein